MAYTHSALGLDLSEVIAKGGPAVQAASKIIQDPALPEVTCNVLRLSKVVEGRNAGPPCSRKTYSVQDRRKGVGLHLVVTPLRAAVWARKNPVLAAGAGVAVVGLLVGIGYHLGRKKK